jgi:hypothetical protein
LQRDLPPVGSDVVTTTGRGRVLAQEILAGQVLIETEDMRRIVIQAADVLTVLARGKKQRALQSSPAKTDESTEESALAESPGNREDVAATDRDPTESDDERPEDRADNSA